MSVDWTKSKTISAIATRLVMAAMASKYLLDHEIDLESELTNSDEVRTL